MTPLSGTLDPISQLLELLRHQYKFFLGCAELDGFYFDLATQGMLTTKRQRPPRRGWTRADINRTEHFFVLEEYLENLDRTRPLSRGPKPKGKTSTRVGTAFRFLQWRKSISQAYSQALSFCDHNISLNQGDAATIRSAVETHLRWVEAYVKMSEQNPMEIALYEEWEDAIQALVEMSKITSLIQNATKGQVARNETATIDQKADASQPVLSRSQLSEKRKKCGVQNAELMVKGIAPDERVAILKTKFPELELDKKKLQRINQTHHNRKNKKAK